MIVPSVSPASVRRNRSNASLPWYDSRRKNYFHRAVMITMAVGGMLSVLEFAFGPSTGIALGTTALTIRLITCMTTAVIGLVYVAEGYTIYTKEHCSGYAYCMYGLAVACGIVSFASMMI